MFSKKYIFETKKTRFLRYLKNSFFFAALTFCAYSLFCFLLILASQHETGQANEFFYNRPPDLIVVFTGDEGRIPFAMKKAKEFNQPHVFITGVYSSNTVMNLLDKQIPTEHLEGFKQDLIEIDYRAQNTVENVISTLHYTRDRRGIKKVLIISHDYHIMRIQLIMEKLIAESDQVQFYYMGLKSDITTSRGLKLLYKEVFKLMRTILFLIFWSP